MLAKKPPRNLTRCPRAIVLASQPPNFPHHTILLIPDTKHLQTPPISQIIRHDRTIDDNIQIRASVRKKTAHTKHLAPISLPVCHGEKRPVRK